MCLYPKLIKNRKYIPNKKNEGNPPELKDQRVKYVPVGCGKCMECKRKKSREWQVRLQEEIKERKDGKFVTLTFSEESLKELEKAVIKKAKKAEIILNKKVKPPKGYEMDNSIAKIGTRRFLERWRKITKKSVRHWLVTEIGQKNTERIHIHGIIFTEKKNEEIEKIWKYGNIFVGKYVNEKTVNYIVKYINKTDQKHKEYESIVLTSAGIGKRYLKNKDWNRNKYKGKETIETYKTKNGSKTALPIYYRNYIYNEKEREKLWIHKLDEETRFINGVKIDVSNEKGMRKYYKKLETERKRNARLGYGDDSKNWDRIEYENSIRDMKKINRNNKGDSK